MYNLETIDNLLKNEISAVETYLQVLAKFKAEENTCKSAFLLPIYMGHENAVSSLQNHMREMGATPAAHTGNDGAWAKIIQSGIKMFGLQTALNLLLEAENSCAANYEQVLLNQQLPLSIRCLIEWKLLLIQKSHTRILDKHLHAMPA
jgi:hypothetical protein